MAAEGVETGDVLSLHVWERSGDVPPYLQLGVQYRPGFEFRLKAEAHPGDLQECCRLADQALWAWGSGGVIGLQAYLMSRPDSWHDVTNYLRAL